LSFIDFNSGNFSSSTPAVVVNNGGVIKMQDCNFADIIGSSALTIDNVIGEVDMQIRRCKFTNCKTS
jgi:hypothetical protein